MYCVAGRSAGAAADSAEWSVSAGAGGPDHGCRGRHQGRLPPGEFVSRDFDILLSYCIQILVKTVSPVIESSRGLYFTF